MTQQWIYHKTEEPQIINSDDVESFYNEGWNDSPAKFIKTTDFNIDPENDIGVQHLGETIEGIKDMANGALNLGEMTAKELDTYALEHFNEKLKKPNKPDKVKEIEVLING